MMDCPYCGSPMAEGTLYNLRRNIAMIWLPQGVKPPFFYSEQNYQELGGLVLGRETKFELTKMGGVHVPMAVCRKCKKGIVTIE